MERTIVHLDLDTFFVSVERLMNSALAGKPVIIGGTGDRGVVASCSYEARAFGVHSAMPVKMAKYLCPQALFIRGDYEQYEKYSAMVTGIIQEVAPVVEKASIDEHYLDLTGMDQFFGCLKWTTELKAKIKRDTGLPISFGMSGNKTVSKIATGESKPNGALEIKPENVRSFLDPLSVSKIPMVGEKTSLKLRSMGIPTIQALSSFPVRMLEKALGENGKAIWLKANGVDHAPVEPYTERKSISAENTFQQDTTDVDQLNEILIGMIEGLAYQLRKENKVSSCITVKIRYSNFDTHTRQLKIPFTSADHTLMNTAKALFDKLYSRRMLVRLIGVRLTGLVSGSHQINLFEDTEEMVSLYQAMDRMRRRFGDKAVGRAICF
jgi:DNA polymerase-4